MRFTTKVVPRILTFICLTAFSYKAYSQNNTQIRGFVDASVQYSNNKLSFGLGEQDLFITSDLNDRLSFLGETVFRYDPSSRTNFSVSVERIIIKYNIKGNHNILLGKHHTPINYWNDTYHHGRVFFPTVGRPLIFSSSLFPLHTTGLSIQGLNLGPLKFGYDIMIGNGLGSSDILDFDKSKSVTAAMHIKPRNALRIGVSYYYDHIAKGADLHNGIILTSSLKEHLITASVANFGNKVELLTESTLGLIHSDSTGARNSLFSYVYAGYKLTDKIIPYVRLDNMYYHNNEISIHTNNTTSYVAGVRYQINFLAVLKLEYQHQRSDMQIAGNSVTTQIAIGF